MAATAPTHRAEMGRGPARTSSIDSAISSISGSTRSQETQSPPDVANLIQAAGSPEAVIQFLLKEKSSQAAQNAQLWRLVDKQRAMILGLNKDLERAIKDKDRYRKKLKENLAQISNPSPVESMVGVESDTASISSDQKTIEPPKSKIETLVSSGLRESEQDRPDSPIDVALAPYPITPPGNAVQTSSLNNMIAAEQTMPSPTQHAFQNYNPDALLGFGAGQQQRKPAEVAREMPYNASVPPSRGLPSDPPRHPPPNAPPPKAPESKSLPSLTVIAPTPNPDEGLRAFPTPPRKAPPAPLNLGKQASASSHLREASGAGEESDSDYDDILEVDEIPTFVDRGRRKTREDDDRQREVAAMRDAEARSLSKKKVKSTSKSKPTTPREATFPIPAEPMPTNPRTIPISPPDLHLRQQFASADSGSLAGVLSGAVRQTVVSPPLMSPGLPLSPRPIDRPLHSPMPRGMGAAMGSPPMSPRGMGAFPGAMPLSPRAPRQPIPLPPNTPMSITSPGLPRGQSLNLVSPKPLIIAKKAGDTVGLSPNDGSSSTRQTPTDKKSIYRGLVTEEYPDLLLPPNALPSIDVRVASSRLKPSRASIMFPKNVEEDPVFTLAIFARSDGKELWRVEKDIASLGNLDHILKQSSSFTARTPDKSLFSGHAPAKVDARRAVLDQYLGEILDTQMDTASALDICKYLSTNVVAPHSDDLTPSRDSPGLSDSPVKTGPGGRPLKNGYLTKRGKNFGGWKARFFVLDGPVFKYYESPGGPHLGAIKLQSAQIGKQQQQADNHSPSRGGDDDPDNQYRHAFLILEPKRKDSSSLVRHVLCAESDQERDQWVAALLQYVDFKDEDDEDLPVAAKHEHTRNVSGGSTNGTTKKKLNTGQQRSQTLPDLSEDNLRGISYENTKPGSTPQVLRAKHSQTPSPPTHGHERDPLGSIPQSQALKNISAPKNAQVIQDTGAWGTKHNLSLPDDKNKQKKRSFFGFGSKPRVSNDNDNGGSESTTNLMQMAFEQHGPIRPTFGASLSDAVKYNHPADVNVELPAVMYRCIEYLDAKNAALEEGIFRLSGSNVVIKQLRERFNTEGDVNLVTDDQYYDIHAVASLLKLYLRELPSTILTRELHLEFLAVTELQDVGDKIRALNGLVHRLPRVNNMLLQYLSGFLINIINHSDTNKMTVRNVGIVFSPTLNIPAPVFALFLQQYDGIFGQEPDSHGSVEVTVTAPPLTPEDIRSPRRQKFQQDLPTPSYNQQSFHHDLRQAPPPFSSSQRGAYDTGFTPLHQSYESQQQPTMAGPEYGRVAQTLAGPSYEQHGGSLQQPTTKSKRRESSMFGMGGLGQRKPSNNRLNDARKSRI